MAKKRSKKKKQTLSIGMTVTLVILMIAAVIILWTLDIIKLPDILGKNKNTNNTQTTVDTSTTDNTSINTNDGTSLTTVDTSRNDNLSYEGIVYDDFQIHFMMLGNDKAGDSIYIKAGDCDILIDAGSRSGSSSTTISYMDNYIEDNTLEYVIATHGDQDHVEAFPKILEHYKAKTIIRNQYSNKTSAAYNNMLEAFTNQVKNNGAKEYMANDCFDNTNGASKTYELSTKVTMDIIYNYYYWNKASDENDYSVCLLFTYNDGDETRYFFFTGDLEETGEKKLAEYYDGSTIDKTLPKVDLFKAGHHGSKTSSNDCLLNIIQPKMCVVCCCCGTNEYTGITDNQFPTQDFINRIAKWTDNVYVTTVCESYIIDTAIDNGKGKSNVKGVEIGGEYIHSSGYKALNGNIIVSASKEGIGLSCSNNTTKLKDTEWFNATITLDGESRKMRVWPEY